MEPLDLPDVPGVEKNRFDAMVRSVARLEDPVLDGWSTEAFNDVADKQLKLVGQLIADGAAIESAELTQLVSESFTSNGLRPTQLSPTYKDDAFQVQRGSTDSSTQQQGHEGFRAVLQRIAEPLGRNFRSSIQIQNRPRGTWQGR